MFGLFKSDQLYIKVSSNYVEIIDVDKNKKVNGKSIEPFSSERLLIAEFSVAEDFMNDLINKLKRNNRSNAILFHPIDFVEGRISEVETRIFLEISARLKGRKVKIWVGQELTNKRVIEELNKK
jgi:hypothetical protein